MLLLLVGQAPAKHLSISHRRAGVTSHQHRGVDIHFQGRAFDAARNDVGMLQTVRRTCYDVATLVLNFALVSDTSIQP